MYDNIDKETSEENRIEGRERNSEEVREISHVEDSEEDVEDEACDFCGGTGWIETPAEQRGGDIVGPDSHPCPACKAKNEE